MKNPLISVILPVHNGEQYVVEAIESVLSQNYHTIELIVINDGSTDKTSQVISALKTNIRYLYQANQGPAAARNNGLNHSHGEMIAFLDADDLWPDGKLNSQVNILNNHSDIQVVLGKTNLFGDIDRIRNIQAFKERDYTYIQANLGSGLFRKSVFDLVGLFDETLRFGEDQDWFLRAREHDVRIALLDQVTLLYRVHGSNMTRIADLKEYTLTRFLKKSLDRRRSTERGAVQPLQKFSHTLIKLDGYGEKDRT